MTLPTCEFCESEPAKYEIVIRVLGPTPPHKLAGTQRSLCAKCIECVRFANDTPQIYDTQSHARINQ
jgi:hypothetical protein